MKGIILIYCLLLLGQNISSQEIGITATPICNVFHTKPVSDQTFGSPRLGLAADFYYLPASKHKNLKFGLGLGYQTIKVLNVIPVIESWYEYPEKINLLTIGFKSNFKLSKDFHFALDPIIGFQINHNQQQLTDNQSGLGLTFAIGGSFRLNNYLLFNVEPRLWMYNLIPFNELESPFRLAVAGINLGLAFNHKSD